MEPAGTAATNPAYFSELTAQINAIQGTGACAEIQRVVNLAFASIQAELTSIRNEIAKLVPIVAIPSASPGAIVTWITNFVAPYEAALVAFNAQVSAIISGVAALAAAIGAAAARLVGCTITIPTVA